MKREPTNMNRLYPGEARIMALWDEGLGIEEIAAQAGRSVSAVTKITSRYSAEDPWEARARAASVAMAKAVLAVGSYA